MGTWESVLQKAVALSPSDRWKTASELLAALAANLDQPTTGAVPGGLAADPTGPHKNFSAREGRAARPRPSSFGPRTGTVRQEQAGHQD